MKLPRFFRDRLHRFALRRTARPADYVIGRGYLDRWYLTPWAGHRSSGAQPSWRQRLLDFAPVAYLHVFFGSDDDRALHDHPAASMTLLLSGGYYEHLPAHRADPAGPSVRKLRRPGQIVFRRAKTPHRIELISGKPCMTLFVFGFRLRRNQLGKRDPRWWGFWCKHGWRHWRIFTDPNDPSQIGRGCG